MSTMAEDYLKILWKAEERGTGPVTTRDIAATLGVAASSVSGNLRKLDRDELIVHEPYHRIALTDRGRRVAVGMVRRHRLIETFLVGALGYGWHEVHDEAEVLEHAVSDVFLERIDALLGRPVVDPHGDPIPSADGTVPLTPGALIAALPDGACGTVVRVYDDRPELLEYLAERGIAIGGHVRVVQRMHGAGILRVERDEASGAGGSREADGPQGLDDPARLDISDVSTGSPAAVAVDLPETAADAIWLAPDQHATGP